MDLRVERLTKGCRHSPVPVLPWVTVKTCRKKVLVFLSSYVK